MAGASNKSIHNICQGGVLDKHAPPPPEDEKVVKLPPDVVGDNAGSGAVTPSVKRHVMLSSVGETLEI
ncbi:MAG TPA: hypothetical protein EYP39_03055, partial [Ghiorsea sp.]|nr:hypothetical protein [Ghiorsea sp.]